MKDEKLLRYSRQILLPEIDIAGQKTLLASRVIIIGLGGLGAPVAMYLAAAGIGHLTLVDFDEVDLSNLQRQIIHTTETIGLEKVVSAKQHLQAINPDINYRTIDEKLSANALKNEIVNHDVVVDCTDNFPIRFTSNKACVDTKTPLVSGAVIRMEGQVTTFDYRQADQACYQCLYGEEGETEDTCSTTGILAPVAGIVGSIQATEVLKLLTGLPTLAGRLLMLDAKYMDWREIKLKKDHACPVCGQH